MTRGDARRRGLAAAGLLIAVGVGLLHTSPVRRAVLARAVATLADRFDIVLRADRLDYNLLALRVSLNAVAAAASHSADAPFFSATRVTIELPRSALVGRFAIDRIRVDGGAIDIRRARDGRLNLPSGDSAPGGEPAALALARLEAPALAVAFQDEARRISLAFPDLSVDIARETGDVRLRRAGRLTIGDTETSIAALGGGVTFDGRAIALDRFLVETGDGTATLGGTLDLLVSEPRADVRFQGTTDARAIARWAGRELPSIPSSFEGTLVGPLEDPAIDARATATFAGGAVSAAASAVPASGRATIDATLDGVDLERLLRAFDAAPAIVPAGRGSGLVGVRIDSAALSSLDVRGTVAAVGSARGRIQVPGSFVLRVSNGSWRLDADHRVEGIPLRARLDGRLDAARLMASTLRGRVQLREADASALTEALRRTGAADVPEDSVTAGRLSAGATLGGTFERPVLSVTVRGDGLRAAGVEDLAARLEASGTLRELAASIVLRQGPDNEVTATGTVFPEARRLDLAASGRIANVRSLGADVPFDGPVTLDAEIGGPFSAVTTTGRAEVADAVYDRVRLGPLAATFEVTPAGARATLVARALNAEADLTIGGDRRVEVDLRVDNLDLVPLLRDVDLPAPVTGRVTVNAQGDVPLDDWRSGSGVITVSGLHGTLGDLSIAAGATASLSDRLLRITGLEANADGLRITASGALGVDGVRPDGEGIRARLEGAVGDLLAAVRATRLAEVPGLTGSGAVAFDASVTGSLTRPALAADLEVSNAELAGDGLPPVRNVTLRARLADGAIEPAQASADWQGSRIEAEGRAPLRLFEAYLPEAVVRALPPSDRGATLTARVSSITPEVLRPFVSAEALSQMAGAVDASLRLESASLDPEALRGELRLDRLEARVAGLPISQREPTRVVFENGLARVAAWDWTGQGATLGVQGQVRLRDREAAILAAGRFDVRLLSPFVRDTGLALAGTLAPRVAILGPLTSPAVDGELSLEGADIRLREPRIVATEIDAFAVLSLQRARITNLTGVVNGGTLTGGGELSFAPGAPASGRLTAVIVGMGLELPEGLRSELDADLALSVLNAPAGASGTLTGTVTVTRSAYREPLAVVTGLLGTLRTERALGVVPAETFASRLTLDVRVVTDGDIVVDNNLARAQFGGDLRVIGTAAAPSLSGRAEIREGGQLFLGNNVYTIESGTIDFVDPAIIRPQLNVEALTRAGGHEIALTVTGPADAPKVDLRSNTAPELGQIDVASLLLVGRTFDEVPGAEAQIVGEQVLGYLSGDLLGVASRRLGVDSIRLGGPELRRDPATVATQTDPTSRLTFGKSLGSDVDLTYSQNLRSGEQTWIVDYRPWRRVNLRVVSDDETLRAYEFRHDLSLGGPPSSSRAVEAGRTDERVAEVVIDGAGMVSAERLRSALGLREGRPFDFGDWQRDRDRVEEALHAAGFLESRVATTRETREDGVVLQYRIVEGPRTVLRVAGHQLSAATRAAVEAAWTQAIVDEFLEEDAAAIVRDAVVAEGYLGAKVTASVTAGGEKVLEIVVEPGPRAADRRLEVTAGDPRVAREMGRLAETSGIDPWREPDALRARLLTELRARGRLQASVAVNAPRVEGTRAVLPVAIEEGSIFIVSAVEVAGADRVNAGRIREAAALPIGSPALPSELDEAAARIEALYRGEGYPDVRTVADVMPGAGTAAVTFVVEEGPRQVLQEVAVRGNRGIDEDVITRHVETPTGSPLPADAWLEVRTRLFETGLFRRVDVLTEPVPDAAEAPDRPVRLIIVVEEWPVLRVRYGFQVAERRPEDDLDGRELAPGLSLDVTRRTLFGRAVTVGLAGEYQPRERRGRVFLGAPTVLGLPVESLFTAEQSRESFADATLITDRFGVSWEQRLRLENPLELSYTYRVDRDHTFDTGPGDPIFGPVDLRANIARLTGAVVFDTRDDPTDTLRGSLLSSTVELSSEALGSDADFGFVRYLAQAYHFQPWRRVLFASAARLGVARTFADRELVPSERFYAGGPSSVRGVGVDSLGPRLFGDPAGGLASLVLNQEVRVPLFKWVRGVGFLDSGNAFDAPGAIDLRRFVTSYGVGVRVETPFALLRVDYARPWTTLPPEVSPVRWTFGIGQAF